MGETKQESRKRIGTFTRIAIAMLVPFAIGLFFLDPSSEGTLGVLGAGWLWLVALVMAFTKPKKRAREAEIEAAVSAALEAQRRDSL